MIDLVKAIRVALWAPTPILAWIVITLLFTISGPFGTYGILSLLPRFGFFALAVGLSLAFGVAARAAIQQVRPGVKYLPASVGASALTAGLVALILPPVGQRVVGLPHEDMPNPAELALVVMFLGIGVVLLRLFLSPPGALPGDDPVPAPTERPRLLSRLAPDIDGAILHLSVSDHYVEVATERGSGRVLMRFSDAVDEVAPVEGLQVHRSHWVARKAVMRIERQTGRTFVILTNGTRVPVSRAYLSALDGLRGS